MKNLYGDAWEPVNHGSKGNDALRFSRFVCGAAAVQEKLHFLVNTRRHDMVLFVHVLNSIRW